jgi:hypothetical protein
LVAIHRLQQVEGREEGAQARRCRLLLLLLLCLLLCYDTVDLLSAEKIFHQAKNQFKNVTSNAEAPLTLHDV